MENMPSLTKAKKEGIKTGGDFLRWKYEERSTFYAFFYVLTESDNVRNILSVRTRFRMMCYETKNPHGRSRGDGAPSENRTPDTMIKSHVLYRLS